MAARSAVAQLMELARPVVRARTSFHSDQTGMRRSDGLRPLGARHGGPHPRELARLIHPVQGKHVLRQVDADAQNGHRRLLLD